MSDEDDELAEKKHKPPSRGVSAALQAARPKPPNRCGRCQGKVTDATRESCHVCAGPLCPACWEQYGECGHHKGRAA